MGGATRFLTLLSTPLPLRPLCCPSILRFTRHRHNHHRHFSSVSHYPAHSRTFSTSPRRSLTSFSLKSSSSQQQQYHAQTSSSTLKDDNFSNSPFAWPEWINFLNSLSVSGNYDRSGSRDDEEFVDGLDLTEEFVRGIRACLEFARERPYLLRELTREDIEVLVKNGLPLLFKDGDDSIRKMRLFLSSGNTDVISDDKAQMIDLMKFIVSFAGNATSPERSSFCNFELVEPSFRNLLSELLKLSYTSPEANFANSLQSPFTGGYSQASRTEGQNIEMKRGDWICPSCSFMNFARNTRCLECEHARPKRQLTGREWECPQCDFVNFGRNTVCLRCDCKRPEVPPIQASQIDAGYGVEKYTNKTELERKLAANEEKAQRWFSKVSLLDSTSTTSSSIVDEDFPEIMPLRKGVNRFVVSTRKTQLERRQANAQYRDSLSAGGTSTGDVSETKSTKKTPEISQHLADVLRHESTASQSNSGFSAGKVSHYAESRNSNSSYVPFVPLPADMFAKKPDSLGTGEEKAKVDVNDSLSSDATRQMPTAGGRDPSEKLGDDLQRYELPVSEVKRECRNREQEEESERWSKRVAELHDTRDLTSAISDDELPDIMPMRKGGNRFVVGKKKDRSLTSPMYKRRAAIEQTTNSSFVPFVPFPPDYFAKKETAQLDGGNSADTTSWEASTTVENADKLPKTVDSPNSKMSDVHQQQGMENREFGSGSMDRKPVGNNSIASSGSTVNEVRNGEIAGSESVHTQSRSQSNWGSGFPEESRNDVRNKTSSTPQPSRPSESNNFGEKWTGRSLEGSAVKEPDPLDMSEEAKAERWFRRAAQIKDISELSQIPDEDFPSIMPMRKGVNRFVVSKRKTPLERRLTSLQYRRNLPTVSSDAVKKPDDNK